MAFFIAPAEGLEHLANSDRSACNTVQCTNILMNYAIFFGGGVSKIVFILTHCALEELQVKDS